MSRMFRTPDRAALQKMLAGSHVRIHLAGEKETTAKPRRAQKFNAVATEMDGLRFGSKKEAARYLLLRDQERRGEIQNLLVHGRVALTVGGELVCHFEPDFLFERDGRLCAEDTKGMRRGPPWELFMVKARLFEALYKTRVNTL